MQVKLYYHKTDGGAEYLTDSYTRNPDGSTEGVFENAQFVVRIDGDIHRDAELSIAAEMHAAPALLDACEAAVAEIVLRPTGDPETVPAVYRILQAAIALAKP